MIIQSIKKVAVLSALFLSPLTALADDTELFTGANVNNNARPQVMIILDTSGSMGWDAPKASYNASITYPLHDKYPNPNAYYKKPDNAPKSSSECKKKDGKWKCLGNYLNWYKQPVKKRITLARDSIRQLINDNSNVDFGLAAFIDGDYSGYGALLSG